MMFSYTLFCYEKQLMCRLSTVDHNSSVVVFRIYAEKLLLQRNRHDFMSDMWAPFTVLGSFSEANKSTFHWISVVL